MNGIIVGIQNEEGQKIYRVVLYNRTADGCQYNKQAVPEQMLINALRENKLVLDNAKLVDNKIKGTTGDLARFKANGFRPMVVMTEIVTDDKVIGYRLATYDGKVTAIRIKEVLAYCARVSGNGAPFQNAMYVAETPTSKAYLRAFPGQTFYQEKIQRNKSKTANPAVVDKKTNEKQVSKLEELFNPAQIQQLKLGKAHGVDIRIFGNNKLSADQMKELRQALEDGVDARAFADPAYSVSAMKALRINSKYGVDITYFVNSHYNAEQIYELSTGYLSGVDISQYADHKLSAKDMSKKRVYLESQLWNEVEAKPI